MSIVVVCKCGKRLRADRSHAGKRARCSNCGHVLMLPVLPDVPSPCALDDPEIPYYVIQNGQKQGPFTRAELKSRRLRSDSLVWQSGLTGWQRVDQLIELKALLTELQVSVSNKDKPPPLYDPRAFETLYSWFRVSVVPGTIGCTVLAFVPGVLLVANLVYSLYLIVAVVFYMMLLYKSWKQIQDGAVRTTPGKAVGLLFVPFFNLYWNFVALGGLAQDANRYAAERGLAIQPISSTLAKSYGVLAVVNLLTCWVPVLGLFINVAQNVILLFLLHQVKDASVVIATAKLIGSRARTMPSEQ